jgi:hypothetical protein
VLLGAVYNRYRLGEPTRKGLIASPPEDSKHVRPPVDEIKKEKAEAGVPEAPTGRTKTRPASSRHVAARRGAVLALVSAVVAGDFFRRKRRGSTSG